MCIRDISTPRGRATFIERRALFGVRAPWPGRSTRSPATRPLGNRETVSPVTTADSAEPQHAHRDIEASASPRGPTPGQDH